MRKGSQRPSLLGSVRQDQPLARWVSVRPAGLNHPSPRVGSYQIDLGRTTRRGRGGIVLRVRYDRRPYHLAPARMDIVFLQTADAGPYFDLLTVSSRSVRAYCERYGFAYEAYVGIKRGYHPWHAAFNRIYLLDEVARQGRYDWAVYMDVDTFIADPAFDLRRYLQRKDRYAGVLTPSGATREFWDVNDGVVMLNLRHPYSRRLLDAWRVAFEAVSDAELRLQQTWSNPDDQEMLQAFLREDPDARRMIHLAPRKLFNAVHARVIRQLVRAHFPEPASRLRTLIARVTDTLGPDPLGDSAVDGQEAAEFVDQVYRGVLRRAADPSGLSHFVPLVRQLGFEAGARLMMKQMLASDEYLSRSLEPYG